MPLPQGRKISCHSLTTANKVNSLPSQQTIPYRPLGIVKNLTESLGFVISHTYEDLIFIEHNAFLLRMEEVGDKVSIIFNDESEQDKRAVIAEAVRLEGIKHNLDVSEQGTYTMKANETGDSFDIVFLQS